jgi:hypothetical protein
MTFDHLRRFAVCTCGRGGPAVVLAIAILLGTCESTRARTCSQVHQACVSKCMRLGIGASRRSGVSRPMSHEACEAHCIGWTSECKKTGCFNGDLHQECGLVRK